MADGLLALTWNNHSSTFCKTISSLRIKERYTDATITCEGKFYQVHKFVLATCSEYFEKIFEETPCKHPVIVLRDVSCDELEALLNYMYIGSVSVAQSDLARLIKVAELLQIKGLAVPDDPPPTKSNDVDSQILNSESRDSFDRSPYAKNKHVRSADDNFSNPRAKRIRSHDSISGSQGRSAGQSSTSSSEQIQSFNVKEEVQEVEDSDSKDHESMVETELHSISEGDELPQDDQSHVHDDPQLATPYLTSSDSQDIHPDEQSLVQPLMGHHTFSEELVALPGPSDAQEWYSEGSDTSGGLPLVKGASGDPNQDLSQVEGSQQQQSQRMMEHLPPSMKAGAGRGGGIKLHECLSCNFTTWRKFDMVRHMSVHTGERPHSCPFCPASFSLKGNLKTHIRIHTGEKPFACPHCSYRAAQKQALKAHIVNKHSKNV